MGKYIISWLQSPSAVILEPQKIKSDTVSAVPPSVCHEVMGPDAMIFVFWMLSFKPAFSLSSFTFIKRLFISGLSIMFHWSICLSLCQYHTVLMTVALQYSLKSGRLIPPVPFFFLKIALAIRGFFVFPYKLWNYLF